jgi:FXSXX-COOH protein
MRNKLSDTDGVLIDVSGLSLDDLKKIDKGILRLALRRVLTDSQSEPVAGFTSHIEDDQPAGPPAVESPVAAGG